MASSISRTPSAFASLGNSMTSRSDNADPPLAATGLAPAEAVPPAALVPGGSVPFEAREAALMQFRIGDRPALNSLPFSAESGISRQQPLVRLAVDHILRASQDVDTSPG